MNKLKKTKIYASKASTNRRKRMLHWRKWATRNYAEPEGTYKTLLT